MEVWNKARVAVGKAAETASLAQGLWYKPNTTTVCGGKCSLVAEKCQWTLGGEEPQSHTQKITAQNVVVWLHERGRGTCDMFFVIVV